MNHIFISYSRKDIDVVNQIVKKIRNAGVDVWQDISGPGTGIPFSTKWFSVIEEAIHMAGGAVIIRSDSWEQSTPCNNEMNIIKRCDLPYIEISPISIHDDIDAVLARIMSFFENSVKTKDNEKRTDLFAAAYEIKSGVNPSRLINNTKNFVASFVSNISDYFNYRRLIKKRQYRSLNTELFPYINKFLRALARTMLFKTIGVVAVFLLVITAFIFIRAIPEAMEIGSEKNQDTYYGQSIAAKITSAKKYDPILAMGIAEELDEKYLTVSSYYSLCTSGTQLMEDRLPEIILTPKDKEYETIMSAESYKSSDFFKAESSIDSGGIIITELKSGNKRTINTTSKVNCIAWDKSGEILAFSTGVKVFVFDAVGNGAAIPLLENFEQVSQLKILDNDGIVYVIAITNRSSILLWKSPFNNRDETIRTTDFGVFLESDEPTAVYIDGRDIVIRKNDDEKVISPDIPESYGNIKNPYYSVTSDGSKIAFICENDVGTRIVCISLKDKKTLIDVSTEHPATAVTFSTDGNDIYASAKQCAIIHVDITNGKTEYGQYNNLYFTNISTFGSQYVLSDYYGNCCVFDGTVMKEDMGNVNYSNMPFYSMTINSEKGYLYTVNRGAGTTTGCSRFNLNTGKINLFVVPEIPNVDANTSVAMSKDGKYVAFGYPDGRIRVYEQEHMYLIFDSVCIGESVSAICFSKDDSVLYILGSTGKMYSHELPELLKSADLASMQSNWAKITQRLSDKRDLYYKVVPANTVMNVSVK